MKNRNKIKTVTTWIAGGVVVLAAWGCSQTPINHAEKFDPQLQKQDVQAILRTQEAAGARAESTLYAQHFDGPVLSSLGTKELDLVLTDSHSCNPLVIYLDLPTTDYAQDRKDAIGRYLMDKGGLKTDQIVFREGANPAAGAWVEDHLKNYDRTDSSTALRPSGGAGIGFERSRCQHWWSLTGLPDGRCPVTRSAGRVKRLVPPSFDDGPRRDAWVHFHLASGAMARNISQCSWFGVPSTNDKPGSCGNWPVTQSQSPVRIRAAILSVRSGAMLAQSGWAVAVSDKGASISTLAPGRRDRSTRAAGWGCQNNI